MSELARINTNVAALRAYLHLSTINDNILKAAERVSTGSLVNRASDDPARYGVKRLFERTIDAKTRANENLERGVDWLQTNDSQLAGIVDMLQEMSDLANQAKAGGVTSAERVAIQLQLNSLRSEIVSVLQSGVSAMLYSGFTLGNLSDVSLTGSTTPTAATLNIETSDIDVTGSPSSSTVTAKINTTISNVTTAITRLTREEQQVAAWIYRLEFQKDMTDTELVNLKASLSTIADADVALEQVELTKNQILQQTAMVMLTQANTAPAALLSLFGVS